MNLYIKTHHTEKIPTSKGTFLGLPKSQSTRNLEVGDYFCLFNEKEDLLIFIQKEWEKVWFLGLVKDKVNNEIEYNVLTDKIDIIKADRHFEELFSNELENLKNSLSFS